MFGTTNFPLNFVNRNGIPLIESGAVEATETNAVITIARSSFRWLNQKGIILFRLNQVIPESAATLPIVFSWSGRNETFTQPLTIVGGETATATNLNGVGVFIIYYDKDANVLQLLTGL